jgi:hypothetical protein
MRKIFFLINVISTFYSFGQSADFSKVSSGIYFLEEKVITSIDPTLVNTIKKGKKSLAQIDGKEANYVLSSDAKFYFKFKPEEKELNSTNSNATNKVGEQNYMNLLLSSTNSKAVSPNEFKLVKLKLKKGKRSFFNGKYGAYGMTFEQSINPKSIIDFKYKKVSDNLYEIYFPNQLTAGEYCFVYMAGVSKEYSFLQTSNFKVFDFSIK